jgi:hypothetical protein
MGSQRDYDQMEIRPHEIADLRLLADKASVAGQFDVGRRLHVLLDAYEDQEGEESDEDLGGVVDDLEANVRGLEESVAALKGEKVDKKPVRSAATEEPIPNRLCTVHDKLDEIGTTLDKLAMTQEGLRKRSAAIDANEQTIGHLVNALEGHYPEETAQGRALVNIANASPDEARELARGFLDALSPAEVYRLAKLVNACAWAVHHLNDQVNESLCE